MPAIRLSVAVQTHPARAEMAGALAEQIPGAELVFDPDPDNFRSPWRTYRHALERTPARATHRLVIQDDTVLVRGFPDAVRAAVRAQPDPPLVLFVAGEPREYAAAVCLAYEERRSWARLDASRWCPAVAVVWPVRLIEPFLDWVTAQMWPPQFTADDEIIGRYFRYVNIKPLATVPSLVEHPDLVPSLGGRRTQGGEDPARVAWCFDPDVDAARIDWSREAR